MTNHLSTHIITRVIVSFLLIFNIADKNAYATTIIIYIGKNEILLGADSRKLRKGYDSDSLQLLETCKIQRSDSLVYTMCGFAHSEAYKFEPYKIVQNHLSGRQEFKLKIAILKDSLTNQLSNILKKIKTNPLSWKMVVTKENRILDLVIVGNINGAFGAYSLGFILIDPDKIQIKTEETFIECTATTDNFICYGELDESKNYILRNKKFKTPSEIIVNAIKVQCRATPIKVGEPINLLSIKPNSHEWLINKNCIE